METITPMTQNWDQNHIGHSHPDYDIQTEAVSSVRLIHLFFLSLIVQFKALKINVLTILKLSCLFLLRCTNYGNIRYNTFKIS